MEKLIACKKRMDENAANGYASNSHIAQNRSTSSQVITQLPEQKEPRSLSGTEVGDSPPAKTTSHGAAGHTTARNQARKRVSAKRKPATKQGRAKSKHSSN